MKRMFLFSVPKRLFNAEICHKLQENNVKSPLNRSLLLSEQVAEHVKKTSFPVPYFFQTGKQDETRETKIRNFFPLLLKNVLCPPYFLSCSDGFGAGSTGGSLVRGGTDGMGTLIAESVAFTESDLKIMPFQLVLK